MKCCRVITQGARSQAIRWFDVPAHQQLGSHPRRGLAPLEFTLALPMLVIMMALMIDFGVVGAWKIRTQANARYAAWRTVNARTGELNPTPSNWPANAPLLTHGAADLPSSSLLWDSTQALACPCVRGQQLTAPNAQATIKVPGRLEMDGFVLEGNAQLSKPLPLLPTAVPGGRFRFNLKQDVFDNQWQFYALGIGWNTDIRADVWWDIEHSNMATLDGAASSNLQSLNQTLQQMQSDRHAKDLYPLDNDDEFTRYGGWPPPDFYPRLGRVCISEPMGVYISVVSRSDGDGHPNKDSLLSRIDALPCSMSKSYATMYKNWICQLEQCGFPDDKIAPLRQRYNDLADFMREHGCPGSPGQLNPCTYPPMATCTCPPSPVGVGH